jgi:hypothetical protein
MLALAPYPAAVMGKGLGKIDKIRVYYHPNEHACPDGEERFSDAGSSRMGLDRSRPVTIQ